MPNACNPARILLLLALCGGSLGFAASPGVLAGIDLAGLQGRVDLGSVMEIFRDQSASIDIARASGGSLAFSAPAKGRVNFGYTGEAIWARLRLVNTGPARATALIEYAYPAIDYVTFYRPVEGGFAGETLGDRTPFSRREFESRNPVFRVSLPPGGDAVFYLRATSSGNIEMPLALWDIHSLQSRERDLQLIYGFVFGLILVMGLYNLFIFISIRDPAYIAYVIFIIGLALGIGTLRGFTYELLFPDSPYFANAAMPFGLTLSDIGGVLFTMLFLKTRSALPAFDRILAVFLGLSFVVAALSFLAPYSIILPVADLLTFGVGLTTIMASLAVRNRAARYFAVAWIALVAGTVLTFLHAFGLLQPSFLSNFGMEIGSCTQVVLLSFSLADKLNLAQKEKQEVQRMAAAEAIETRRRIAELDRLKTLGVLAAGVAHEINTPNNAVIRNLPIVSEVWKELSPIIERFMNRETGSQIRGWNAEELKRELPELIADTYAAGIQIRKIVEDLKDFARDSEGREPEAVDLGAVASYAVRLLTPLVEKRGSAFSLVLAEGLPRVRANFQKLTQVAVNILENAFQSLREPGASVTLRVSHDAPKGRVCLECADEGEGIEEELKAMIFEPFFTTRRETGGMGLGLSVAYGIVRESGGEIEIESTRGKGTRVRVCLPALARSD